MTLIISAAAPGVALQVADTLVTKGGQYYDDKLVKSTIVHCRNGKLIVSYTGLAVIEGKRTDIWLAQMLREVNATEFIFPEIVETVRHKLNKVRTIDTHLDSTGLTVVIMGQALAKSGQIEPAIAEVSNRQKYVAKRNEFEEQKRPYGEFEKWTIALGPRSNFVSVNGAVPQNFPANTFRRKLQRLLNKARTEEDKKRLLTFVVEMLRYHRSHNNLDCVIGEDCTAAFIDDTLKSVSSYYSKGSSVRRIPNIVSDSLALTDIVFGEDRTSSEKQDGLAGTS